ncbi:MAG: glycogen-binding domain-containing protein [Desulfosalsimonas sp.]|uniref:glycogen-binding domain-containing protein n=1 Tax=Desulfosalsimonas sp. TaxID=3073848 RepID=UPI003970B345
MSNTNKGSKRFIFRLTAPDAEEVCIGGDFNGWNPQKHHFKRKAGGFWEKAIMLKPGRYEYKFRVNGDWCIDPANNQVCDNIFGTRNNVILV